MGCKSRTTTWGRTAGYSVLCTAALLGKLSEARAQDVAADSAAETALAPAAPPLGESANPSVLSAPPASYESGLSAGPEPTKPPRKYGVMLDVGAPDGIMTSFVFRPLAQARVHAGLGYNGVS